MNTVTDVNLCPRPSKDMSKLLGSYLHACGHKQTNITRSSCMGTPRVQFFFLLLHFRSFFGFHWRHKESGSLSREVSEETPKQEWILAGPGDEAPPALPVIPDEDCNGGADEADLSRKCLFALCGNWAVTFLKRAADLEEQELTDVSTEKTSTSFLFTIPQSASNYSHSLHIWHCCPVGVGWQMVGGSGQGAPLCTFM